MAAAIIVASTLNSAAMAAGDELLGAASGEHLWLVLEPRGKIVNFELVQHPRAEDAWHFRTQHTMTQSPVALAAWDDDVWLIMPPRSIGGELRREVFTASVQMNAGTGLYYLTPVGRLDIAPSISGLGRLAGVAATPDGVVALLIPAPSTAVTMTRSGDVSAQEPLTKPMLMRLAGGQAEWTPIALPAEFAGARESLLVVGGRRIGLLEPVADNPERCTLHLLQDDDRWSAESFPLDIRSVRAVTQVADQAVAVLDGRVHDRIDFAYLRPTGPLSFASAVAPSGQWTACGFNDQLLLIERKAGADDPVLNVRTIDPLSGAVHEPQPMTRQPLTAGRMWQMTLALGLALSVVLAALLLAPRRGEAPMVEPSLVLPMGRRLIALLIDLVIGAVPTMLVLKCMPADLLAAPVLTFDPAKCIPYLLMVGLSTAVALPMELLIRSSVGKALVAGRITSLDGSRPPAWRVLVRGFLRLIVLAIPPLAVFALGHSHLQGLPDIVARTLVLRRDVEAQPGESEA